MNPSREDLELYVSGNYDGDKAALERAIADDPALSATVADEARLEMLLRDAAASATFCVACDELVRGERCDSCGAAVRPGGYIVESVLVSNAHGRMYVARDANGKQVALKELAFVRSPTAAAIAAFEREAKFLRALDHPAIPRFCASFEEGHGVHTRYYLAQELVVATALDQLDDHWYREAEVIEIAKQVLAIIVYLQSLSPMVIHRDIKPANLLRRSDGTIVLVDFGAAHVDGMTAGVTTVGTFGYMPLEQLAGIVDATTDLYALGASLLHLLTRQEPWRLTQHKTTINVSTPLRAFLDKLVAPDPADRFPSARAALAALDRRDELVSRRSRLRRWTRPLLVAAGTLALVASGAGTYRLLHSPGSTAPPLTVKPIHRFATLKTQLDPDVQAQLLFDGVRIATASDGYSIPVTAGMHHVRLIGSNNRTCDDNVRFDAGKTTTLECRFAIPSSAYKRDKLVRWNFDHLKFHDAMVMIAEDCGVNIVVPGAIDAKVTMRLADVSCDQGLEALLEAHGLWYSYRRGANLLRIAPRKELEAEAEVPEPDVVLPTGKPIDLDLEQAPLRDALRSIAEAGAVNLVLPEAIGGRVTIHAKGVPWQSALEEVLYAHGLWFRYRQQGKILRIAPGKELEAEDVPAAPRYK